MSKFQIFSLMFIGYVSITVQIMQFPVLDFGLDQYGSEPFIYRCVQRLRRTELDA